MNIYIYFPSFCRLHSINCMIFRVSYSIEVLDVPEVSIEKHDTYRSFAIP